MRDFRINLIFEGASEIMRLFIAREAVDKHFALAFPIVEPRIDDEAAARGAVEVRAVLRDVVPGALAVSADARRRSPSSARSRSTCVTPGARRIASDASIFHAMVRFGPALEKRQLVLFRAVEIGAELYAMAASCVRAQMLAKKGEAGGIALADAFCREARVRIERNFDRLFGPDDPAIYRLASDVLKGQHRWLEQGVGQLRELRGSGTGRRPRDRSAGTGRLALRAQETGRGRSPRSAEVAGPLHGFEVPVDYFGTPGPKTRPPSEWQWPHVARISP